MPQSFSGIEQRKIINNFCLNWPSPALFVDEQAYSSDRKAVSLNEKKKNLKLDWDTNLKDPSAELGRADCNLRIV